MDKEWMIQQHCTGLFGQGEEWGTARSFGIPAWISVPDLFYITLPHKNFSKRNLSYWTSPGPFKTIVAEPNKFSELYQGIYAFSYPVNMGKAQKILCGKRPSFEGHYERPSVISTNILGDFTIVGPGETIESIMDTALAERGGFLGAFASVLPGCAFTEAWNNIHLYDLRRGKQAHYTEIFHKV